MQKFKNLQNCRAVTAGQGIQLKNNEKHHEKNL
jgi:hypothetical protein